MTRWAARRALLALPLLWVVSTAVFLLIHLVPGDPVDFMIGENAEADRREELRRAYHLDQPLFWNPANPRETQYAAFFRDLFGGRMRSLHSGAPVAGTLAGRFLHTLLLAIAASGVAAAIAIPLGTLAAWRRGSWVDRISLAGALLGISVPTFWLGPLLILLFSIQLGWLPVSGADGPRSLVLPALTLGTGMAAVLTRIVRAAVLDVAGEDFVRTARAKGLPERSVMLRHGLRAALVPVATVAGLQFGALLAGAIVTEEIFGWPGMGRELVGAIRSRDFPMVQGCVLLIAASWLAVNTLTDLAYTRADPRLRLD